VFLRAHVLLATGFADLTAWIGLVATAGVCLALRDRLPRTVAFGLGLFLVNVALVIGLVWFTYLDRAPVADHLAYLPNLGLAFGAVGGVMELARWTRVPERGVAVVLGLWCTLLAVACARQIAVLHDTETFWSSALAGNPDCSICHYNLGKFFDERGKPDVAAAHYEAALRVEPDAEAAINLGNIRLAGGRMDEATALYRRAVQLDATNTAARRNLGIALAMQGRADEAIAEYRGGLRIAPDDTATAILLSRALVDTGRTGEAVALLENLLERLADADVAGLLAWIRATSPDPSWRDGAAAVRLAEQACELTQYEDPDKLDTLAAAYAEVGRFADAVATARRALRAADPKSQLAGEVRERLALYEAQQPFRVGVGAASSLPGGGP